jgi:cation transport ATPase
LGRITRVYFDKTGTLTDTRATVVDFVVSSHWTTRRTWLMASAASLERGLNHPLAAAVTEFTQGLEASDLDASSASRREVHAGRGVSGILPDSSGQERKIQIGEETWVAGASPGVPKEFRERLGQSAFSAGRLLWLSVDGEIAGVFVIRERLREEAQGLGPALAAIGIQAEVLTGDSKAPAFVAGMRVVGGLSADEKRRIVEEATQAGHGVLVVGDGLNDSPAMAAALTSIAVDSGAGLATATAAAVVSPGALRDLPRAIALGRRIRSGIRSNLVFAAVYNFIGVALAAAGVLHPMVAAVLMLLSSAIVSVRALRSSEVQSSGVAPATARA